MSRADRSQPEIMPLERRRHFAVSYDAVLIQPISSPSNIDAEGSLVRDGDFTVGNLIYSANGRGYALNGDDSSPVLLPPLAGHTISHAAAVNDDGLVVGSSSSGDAGSSHAVLWNGATGRAADLGVGTATAINDNGAIVGNVNNQAVQYVKSGPKTLPDLGGPVSTANDVSDRGVIVGTSDTSDGQTSVPYLYDGRRVYAIGPTDSPGKYSPGSANAINNDNVIVGGSTQGAFLFRSGSTSLLKEYADVTASTALDINDFGEIVGTATRATGPAAMVWAADGSVTDLNRSVSDPTITLFSAISIDDRGEILAVGQQGKTFGTFLLTPQRARVTVSGTLNITGTSGDDQIAVAVKGSKYFVNINDLVVNFPAYRVKRLSISSLDGDDAIALNANITRSAIIDGAAGDDTIYGGSGADIILGGDGNDLLIGNDGVDVIDGGPGADQADRDVDDMLFNVESYYAPLPNRH